MTSKFAPTPMHGAAYAVAIDAVGGMQGIGNCSTPEIYAELRKKLDAMAEWSRGQPQDVRRAYEYGIDHVDRDLQARLGVHENSRRVAAALANLPKPPEPQP